MLIGPTNIPQRVSLGVVVEYRDLITSHKEAVVIIVQQAVKLAIQRLGDLKLMMTQTSLFY